MNWFQLGSHSRMHLTLGIQRCIIHTSCFSFPWLTENWQFYGHILTFTHVYIPVVSLFLYASCQCCLFDASPCPKPDWMWSDINLTVYIISTDWPPHLKVAVMLLYGRKRVGVNNRRQSEWWKAIILRFKSFHILLPSHLFKLIFTMSPFLFNVCETALWLQIITILIMCYNWRDCDDQLWLWNMTPLDNCCTLQWLVCWLNLQYIDWTRLDNMWNYFYMF